MESHIAGVLSAEGRCLSCGQHTAEKQQNSPENLHFMYLGLPFRD